MSELRKRIEEIITKCEPDVGELFVEVNLQRLVTAIEELFEKRIKEEFGDTALVVTQDGIMAQMEAVFEQRIEPLRKIYNDYKDIAPNNPYEHNWWQAIKQVLGEEGREK